jgi:basic membrane protein A and related proteins
MKVLKTSVWFVFLMVVLLLVVGCAQDDASDSVVDEVGEVEQEEYKLAALFTAAVHDEDFNAVGFAALQEVGINQGVQVAYSEKVAIPDTARVVEEYIADGYNIIWAHSGLFNGAILELVEKFPEVSFILEVDLTPEVLEPNVWYVKRNYYKGHYVIGAAAALASETGNIGFVGGAELPFLRSNLNAIQQAIDDLGSEAKIQYIFTGDFADVVKAKQATESLIARGCDVIVSGTNLGNYGIFSAVLESERKVYVTTMYTHQSHHIPDNYLTTDLFNFSVAVNEMVEAIKSGEKGGYTELRYGKGESRYTHFPLLNVSDEINDKVQEIADAVESGEIVVVENLAAIEIKE